MITLRNATAADAPLIALLIRELAEYEKLLDECFVTPQALTLTLFGPKPYAECIVASLDGADVGFALFFHNYSTFLAKPGIYLEDLYVRPAARGQGVGKAALQYLAKLAVERGCGRLEWSVLDWNAPAIGFYESLGARPQDEWTVFRLTGEALTALAVSA